MAKLGVAGKGGNEPGESAVRSKLGKSVAGGLLSRTPLSRLARELELGVEPGTGVGERGGRVGGSSSRVEMRGEEGEGWTVSAGVGIVGERMG